MPSEAPTHCHIFDCDGVVLDSNNLKIESLETALTHAGACEQLINFALKEFRCNFGRTRLGHFRKFHEYSTAHNLDFCEKKMRVAIEKYSAEVVHQYRHSQIIGETVSFIRGLPPSCPVLVVSASDQAELRKVLPTKLEKFEDSNIFGGPTSKAQNLKLVIKNVTAKRFTYYGDSVNDATAALSVGIEFVGLSKYSADPAALRAHCKKYKLACMHTCAELGAL